MAEGNEWFTTRLLQTGVRVTDLFLKGIPECFSCTFTHKIYQKMPRNASIVENVIL